MTWLASCTIKDIWVAKLPSSTPRSWCVTRLSYFSRLLLPDADQILAVQSLHEVGIIHRDIKPDNIFLGEAGHLVLADFGLAENIASYAGGESAMSNFPVWLEARAKNDDDFPFLWINRHNPLGMRGVAGTYWYTAPEVFRKERYSFGVDYWSVGVIYYELITGHVRALVHPFASSRTLIVHLLSDTFQQF